MKIMNIVWDGPHCFVPDLGEVKVGDERTVSYEYGKRLIANKLATQVIPNKADIKKAKENEK